jgi:hypothetical protein
MIEDEGESSCDARQTMHSTVYLPERMLSRILDEAHCEWAREFNVIVCLRALLARRGEKGNQVRAQGHNEFQLGRQ